MGNTEPEYKETLKEFADAWRKSGDIQREIDDICRAMFPTRRHLTCDDGVRMLDETRELVAMKTANINLRFKLEATLKKQITDHIVSRGKNKLSRMVLRVFYTVINPDPYQLIYWAMRGFNGEMLPRHDSYTLAMNQIGVDYGEGFEYTILL